MHAHLQDSSAAQTYPLNNCALLLVLLQMMQLCKSLDEIKAACVAQKGCIAFTYDGKCGYLKTSAGTPMDIMTRRGWTIYTIVQNTGK